MNAVEHNGRFTMRKTPLPADAVAVTITLEPELHAQLEALACVHQDCDTGRMGRLLILKVLNPVQFAAEITEEDAP